MALRSVQTFPGRGEAVAFAVAGRVLLDTDDLVVVATTLGSAVRRPAGRGSGPNARLVLPEHWDGSYIAGAWSGASVVRVHPTGSPWSVWRWHDGERWRDDWYINLERPWVRTPIGFDSQDWTLDVMALKPPGGGWSVTYKDEDELAFYVSRGFISAEKRAVIERAGDEVVDAVGSDAFPFDADWSPWVPEPTWLPAELPGGWAELS